MKVKLLEMTPNALDVLYAACRQCYSPDYVGDLYETDYKNVSHDQKTKLIKHVFNSGHHSVLEHVSFTFAINASSRVEQQQHTRHRMSSYSIQSMRYCNSSPTSVIVPESIQKSKLYNEALQRIDDSKGFYNRLIEDGVPEEDARYFLYLGTSSDIVTTMNCRSLINFFSERLCTLAQWEIRDVAREMMKICKEKLPEIFGEIGPRCKQLGYCPESSKRSCGKMPLKSTFLEKKC